MFDVNRRLLGADGRGTTPDTGMVGSQIQESASGAAPASGELEHLGRIAQASSQLASMGPRLARLGAEMKEQTDAQSRRAAAIAATMEGIASDLERAVLELRASSEQVGDALATVSNIAAHTRIISLNASIEAARAGAHGRAFAVVVE